jgi:hypothetical protein
MSDEWVPVKQQLKREVYMCPRTSRPAATASATQRTAQHRLPQRRDAGRTRAVQRQRELMLPLMLPLMLLPRAASLCPSSAASRCACPGRYRRAVQRGCRPIQAPRHRRRRRRRHLRRDAPTRHAGPVPA